MEDLRAILDGRGRPAAIAIAPLLLLLLSTSQAFAAPSAQKVTLGMAGAIIDSGTQAYQNSGGQLLAASILGNVVDFSTAKLHFNINSDVSGISANGSASFHLDGVTAAPAGQVRTVHLDGQVKIEGMLAAESFPLGCGASGAIPSPPCTSAVPGFYLGLGDFRISVGGVAQHVTLPMMLESAFLNPFGAPIVFASAESSTNPSLLIVSTYDRANIVWHGVKLGGAVIGTGSTSATGSFLLTSGAVEDLVAGTEREHGSWSFFRMTPSSLDANGTFHGNSTIPAPGPGSDCSASTTKIPHTCALTGFVSAGQFRTRTESHGALDGGYVTTWATPSVVFGSAVTATLVQP